MGRGLPWRVLWWACGLRSALRCRRYPAAAQVSDRQRSEWRLGWKTIEIGNAVVSRRRGQVSAYRPWKHRFHTYSVNARVPPKLSGMSLQLTRRVAVPDRVYVRKRVSDSQKRRFVPCGHCPNRCTNANPAGSQQGTRRMVAHVQRLRQTSVAGNEELGAGSEQPGRDRFLGPISSLPTTIRTA